MKIVCDTNVLISAFIFPGGPPDRIFRAILSGRFQNVTSPDLLTELSKVLTTKFHLATSKVQQINHIIVGNSTLVYPQARVEIIKNDPADNRVLECAQTGNASVIVTGDKKSLLPLKKFGETVILTPRDFVQAFKVI